MSVSWFIRNFKKYTGMTPMQFIVSLRVNNAQILLEQTNYSIYRLRRSSATMTNSISAGCFANKRGSLLPNTERDNPLPNFRLQFLQEMLPVRVFRPECPFRGFLQQCKFLLHV